MACYDYVGLGSARCVLDGRSCLVGHMQWRFDILVGGHSHNGRDAEDDGDGDAANDDDCNDDECDGHDDGTDDDCDGVGRFAGDVGDDDVGVDVPVGVDVD